jgi:hypothetical protein
MDVPAYQLPPQTTDNLLVPAASLVAFIQMRGLNLHCKKVKLGR